MQRACALAGDLDMIDMGLVADLDFERGIDLVVAARHALVALDQHRPRALADDGERAGEHRGRRAAGIEEHEMQRPRQRRARGHLDDDAVTHERGVERDRDIVGRNDPAQPLGDRRVAGRQRLRHRADGETRLRARRGRTVPARRRRRPARCAGLRRRRSAAPAFLARALAAASGGAASGFASRISARRSVYFHSSTRRCGRPGDLEPLERGFAQRGGARQAALRRRESRAQGGFSRRPDRPNRRRS